MKKQLILSAALAGIIGGLSSNALAETPKTDGNKVKCIGGNSCKGKGDCHTAENTCSGKNSCKGKSWINTATQTDCDKARATNSPAKKPKKA